jgi:hypothetical protein
MNKKRVVSKIAFLLVLIVIFSSVMSMNITGSRYVQAAENVTIRMNMGYELMDAQTFTGAGI